MVKHLENEKIEDLVKEGIVLVDFYAEWCGPCKMLAPVFEEVAEKYPDVAFAKVDTDEETALAVKFGIQVIPTLVFVKNGEVIKKVSGYMDADALSAIVDSLL